MKQIVKKKMTVKQVESLSEKEKKEYQWTLSKTVEVPGEDIIKPDNDTQSILKQILDRLVILEDGQKQLVQGLKDTNAKVDAGFINIRNEFKSEINNLAQLNNLKTK